MAVETKKMIVSLERMMLMKTRELDDDDDDNDDDDKNQRALRESCLAI